VLAGGSRDKFAPGTPRRLCAARTCYDHLAGAVGVSLNDRFKTLRWLSASSQHDGNAYDLTPDGVRAFQALGIDLGATRTLRRRFAFACLDWSERRPHVGGALGAAILNLALKRRWVTQDLDSRVLGITSVGQRNARSIRASCLTVSSRAVRSLSSFVVTSSISRSSFCCDRMSCSAAHRNSSWLARIVGDNRLNLSVQAFLQSP